MGGKYRQFKVNFNTSDSFLQDIFVASQSLRLQCQWRQRIPRPAGTGKGHKGVVSGMR
jgi:hypothetical protein